MRGPRGFEALFYIIKTLKLSLCSGESRLELMEHAAKIKTQLELESKARYQRKQIYIYRALVIVLYVSRPNQG